MAAKTYAFNQYAIMDLNFIWWLTSVSQKDKMVVRNASTTELKYTVVILAKKMDSFE